MKRIRLSHQEKLDLELRHTQCSDRKEGDRIKAVLLRSERYDTINAESIIHHL